MVQKLSVQQLYNLPGFADMIAEYAQHAIKKMPKPFYLIENYLPLEAAGVLTVWGAMQDGIVTGFTSCIVSKIPHYGVGVAIAESLFVRECARKSGQGIRLIDAVERHAANVGAPAVFFSCPLGSDFAKVLLRRNYSAETTTYVKVFPCSQVQ